MCSVEYGLIYFECDECECNRAIVAETYLVDYSIAYVMEGDECSHKETCYEY